MTPNNLISAFLPSGLTVLPELLVRDCGHTSPRLLPFGIANEPKGLTPFYLERTDRITLGIRFPNHKTYASVHKGDAVLNYCFALCALLL